jgi:hypothetical protein
MAEIERCSECGANLAMVGRSHRCIPKNKSGSAKEIVPAKSKKGRPRIGEPRIGKPWIAAGMSERTWYRRQKESKSEKGG